jgi:hypothetical protein
LCFCVCAVQLLTLFHLYEQCHHRFSPWCCCCCKQRRDRISLRSGSQAPSVNVSPLQRDWWVESVSFLESRRQLANNNLVAMIPSPITLARNGTGRLNQKIHTHITRESNRPQVWTTISPRSVLMNCLVNCPPLQKNKKKKHGDARGELLDSRLLSVALFIIEWTPFSITEQSNWFRDRRPTK